MHTVTMKKKPSMSFTVETPKGRGWMPPPSCKHKDKRRKARTAQRVNFRKENDRG